MALRLDHNSRLRAVRRGSHSVISIGCAILGAGLGAAPLGAEEMAPPGSLGGCLDRVAHGTGREIVCNYQALLTEQERRDMRRLSRGLLLDAACVVEVRVARELVDAALTRADHVFDAPLQPARCTIETKSGSFPITSTFAPHVVFKAGVAVEATPGLGEVTGINRYLAWPIIQYVNRAPGIRKEMLTMINALRPRLARLRFGATR